MGQNECSIATELPNKMTHPLNHRPQLSQRNQNLLEVVGWESTSIYTHIYIHIYLYIFKYVNNICIHKYTYTKVTVQHVEIHDSQEQTSLSLLLSLSLSLFTVPGCFCLLPMAKQLYTGGSTIFLVAVCISMDVSQLNRGP